MTSLEPVLQDFSKKYGVGKLEDIKLSVSSLSALEAIFKEIHSGLLPKKSDYEHRKTLVNTIGELVKNKLGSGNDIPVVEAFGSFTMDMFTADCDLDLSIKLSSGKDHISSRNEHIAFLKKFTKVLRQLQDKGRVQHVQPILSARVPIVKFVDSVTRVECDISVENNDGVLKSLIILLISSIDDRFRILTLLLKVWAKTHNINSSRDHTLNSVSLTLLVIIHLQTRDPPILPPLSALLEGGKDPSNLKVRVQKFMGFGEANTETVAELFVCFFSKLLSFRTFWKHGLCASTFDGMWISSKSAAASVDKINVEDFIHRSENCARAVNKEKFHLIYQCIEATHKQLSRFNKAKIEASELRRLLFGSANACEPKIKQPKKIKVGKRKKLRLLGIDASRTKVVPQRVPTNWDALVDKQKNSETGYYGGGLSEAAVSPKRKQLPGSIEAFASTSVNTAGSHFVGPPNFTNLNWGREDPQKKPGHAAGKLITFENSGAVSDRSDLRKKPRHSIIQTGLAQHQQTRPDFNHHRPPILPHRQLCQIQLMPPCLPHQLYNGSQHHPRYASSPHQSVPVQVLYPGPLAPQNIASQQSHPQDLAPLQPHWPQNLVGMQQPQDPAPPMQPLRPQHLIGRQQPHPNAHVSSRLGFIPEIHGPQHASPKFGIPSTYRLPRNWHLPPCPSGHNPNHLFHDPNVPDPFYRRP